MQSRWHLGVGEHKSYLRRRTVNFSITWGHPLLIFQLGIQVAHLTRVDYLLSSLGARFGWYLSLTSFILATWLSSHWSSFRCLILLMCAPMLRWHAAHLTQWTRVRAWVCKAFVFHLTKWKWLSQFEVLLNWTIGGLELYTWPLHWLIKSPCAEKDAKIIRSPLRRFHPAIRAFIIPCC